MSATMRATEVQTLVMRVVLTMLLSMQSINSLPFSAIYKYGSETAAMQNHVCVGNDVITSTDADDNMRCAFVCSLDEECLGFFYHHGDQTCVTCREWYWNTDSLTDYPGMMYYRNQTGPDVSNDWSGWSTCSRTCGGGTRDRTRTCALPSCNDPTSESASCHDFLCTPLAATCADWASRGLMESCNADIDPDGLGSRFGSILVPCDLGSEAGKAITVIHHNFESRTYVNDYEPCGSYSAELTYSIGFEAAKTIADSSTGCTQYVLWECYNTGLSWPGHATSCTFWKNRNMTESTYFTGDNGSGKYCECGQTDTCLAPEIACNCDLEGTVWYQDGGNVTNKATRSTLGIQDTRRKWAITQLARCCVTRGLLTVSTDTANPAGKIMFTL